MTGEMSGLFDNIDWTLRDAFLEYDRENPHVYRLFCRFVNEAIHAGRTRLGVGAIFERMRWYTTVEARGDAFKLNNNYRAFYARKWMQENRGYPDFFETRRQRYEGAESA